jgi:hydrogenase/urease accessory protein HupE
VVACALLPATAAAHAALPGIEGFYRGLIHPLSTAPPLLALLAIGVALGHRWPRSFFAGWLLCAVGLALGLGVGRVVSEATLTAADVTLLFLAAVAASLAVAAPGRLPRFCQVLARASGIAIGIVTTPDPGPAIAIAVMIAGTYLGANLSLLYAGFAVGWLADRFRQPWMKIGLRVLAAWIAAVAVLLFALVAAR